MRHFAPRQCHWIFFIDLIITEYFLGSRGGRYVGLTNLPYSCADCLEIWKPQPLGTLSICPGPPSDYLEMKANYVTRLINFFRKKHKIKSPFVRFAATKAVSVFSVSCPACPSQGRSVSLKKNRPFILRKWPN